MTNGASGVARSPDWPAVSRWRKAERARLLEARASLPRAERQRRARALLERLAEALPPLASRTLAFYWPIKGEIDVVRFVRGALDTLAAAALPVIVERSAPLEFWQWTSRTELSSRGLWNIPTPVERLPVQPDIVLVPVLGFDEGCYRLGYGGGYYDRTLAVLEPRPLAVGIGFDDARLPTIEPQPHDVPMDLIVTESTTLRR